jgi:MFS transporter, putative metabolite:H+ symporter
MSQQGQGQGRPSAVGSPSAAEGAALGVSEHLETMGFGRFHRSFLLMVTAGEFVETLMLLGNGVVLALVAKVLGFSPAVSTWAVPVSFFAGEFFGSIFSGMVSDHLGRKVVFRYDLLVFGLGMILAGFMDSAFLLGVAVFIGGLGVGGEFPVVDTYTAEMFPARVRGRRMALVYTLAVLAAPVIAALAYGVSHPSAGYYSWRILFWIMGASGLVVWLMRLRVPESPRWLESKGRHAEAAETMRQILKRDGSTASVAALVPQPRASAEHKAGPWSSFREIFAPDLRGRTTMMFVFQFFQSGIFYGFTSLAPLFLEKKGFSLPKTLEFSMIIYAGFFVGSLISLFTIDRIERKWGIVATAVGAGLFGTGFAEASNSALTVILGFITACILWQFSNFLHTYQAEIFPTRVRSSAAGFTYSISRMTTSLFVYVITTWLLPHGVVPSFGLIWLCIIIVVANVSLFGPKTSQRTVEAIASETTAS